MYTDCCDASTNRDRDPHHQRAGTALARPATAWAATRCALMVVQQRHNTYFFFMYMQCCDAVDDTRQPRKLLEKSLKYPLDKPTSTRYSIDTGSK